MCGLLLAHDEADGRRFELAPGAAEALTDESSLAYLGAAAALSSPPPPA